MMNTKNLGILVAMLSASAAAHAGRPLSVDDAGVNNLKAGHVEAWYARQEGGQAVWTVAPAYSPIKDIELGGTLSSNVSANSSSESLQIKWRITPSRDDGCNTAAVLGFSHVDHASGPYVNGILTCVNTWGTAHLNLGGSKYSNASAALTWGAAYERPIGPVVADIEVFGQRQDKPTIQIGARWENFFPKVQLDATLGRHSSSTLFSVGLKYQF